MSDRIEKTVELKASVSRVWRALTDHREFGTWFQVTVDEPFAVGREAGGHITFPGYEHIQWKAMVTAIDPERYFAFRWHPYAIDPEMDYSSEEQTLVEFFLEPAKGGCLLRISESGFDKIPAHRRDEAFRMNDGGWSEQCKNLSSYVADHP